MHEDHFTAIDILSDSCETLDRVLSRANENGEKKRLLSEEKKSKLESIKSIAAPFFVFIIVRTLSKHREIESLKKNNNQLEKYYKKKSHGSFESFCRGLITFRA